MDGIPTHLLKITADKVSNLLRLIFQASMHQGLVPSRECERSGKRSGADQKPVERERSGERVCKNLPERERSVEREAVERKRSGKRAKLAAHMPLKRNSSQIS